MFQAINRSTVNLFLCLLCLGLTACKSNYTIESPTKNSVHETPPTFVVNYPSQPETLPKMTLNGFQVQSFFVAGETSATGDGNEFANHFLEGYNTFHVDPPAGPSVKFIYDAKGPQVVVVGSEIIDGNAIIDGLAVDEVGVVSSSVNGTAITLAADGSFTVSVPESDVYTYVSEDGLGHVSTTLYAAMGTHWDPALTARVTQAGLDAAMLEIVHAINEMDINGMLAGTEIYNATTNGLLGETYGPAGFIRSIDLEADSVSLDLENGNNANFQATINEVYAAITLRSYNGFLPPLDIEIGATISDIVVSGNVALGATDGVPDVVLSNFSFDFGAVDLDGVGDLGDAIITGITDGMMLLLGNQISGAIQLVVNIALPTVLEEVLQQDYIIRIRDSVADHDMSVAPSISAITTTDEALFAALGLSIVPATPDLDVPQMHAGVLYTDDALPDAELAPDANIAVTISTNLINQTLASAHSVGLTHMNLTGFYSQFGLPRDDSLGGEEQNNRLLINNLTAPTVQVAEVADAASITMKVYGLELLSESKKEGVYSNDVGVRVDASIPLSIGVDSDNTLAVGFAATPEVIITGVKLGAADWITSGINELGTEIINDSFTQVAEVLVQPIANIKVPAFACTLFTPIAIEAVGGENSHLSFNGSLDIINPNCNEEVVADTSYGRGLGVPLTCAEDEEMDSGLCYSTCEEGYIGDGPSCQIETASYGRGVGEIPSLCTAGNEKAGDGLCYSVCNAGFHGELGLCVNDLPATYNRGTGTVPTNIFTGECPEGKVNEAGLCYVPCDADYYGVLSVCYLNEPSYIRGIGVIPTECPVGEEKDAGLCYEACDEGYNGVGPVCWTTSPVTVDRGEGHAPNVCAEGLEASDGLCYQPCDEGYVGSGAVCELITTE